jgi:hypothetical protein
MNRWHQVRRLRGAAYLILTGVLALLNQWHILTWGRSWPFFLIVAGLLALAERAAWTADMREQQLASAAQPVPPTSTSQPYWNAPPSPGATDRPFLQTHPLPPEDFGREEQ